MYVARCLDDLWVEAKYLTSLEIAGSPRNISWYRLKVHPSGVEHWMGVGEQSPALNQTPNTEGLP